MKRSLAITPIMTRRIKNFWCWWAAHKSEIQQALTTRENFEHFHSQIYEKLNYISRRIDFKLEGDTESDYLKITFSAHGYRKLFPKIIALTENFPRIPDMEVQAFILPMENIESCRQGTDNPHDFSDFILKISEMYFTIEEYNTELKKLKIKVYLKNYRYHYDNPMLPSAIFIVIEELLGEVACHRYIRICELAQIPSPPHNGIPLYELPEYINRLKTIKTGSRRII
jgi:hypothetical protein